MSRRGTLHTPAAIAAPCPGGRAGPPWELFPHWSDRARSGLHWSLPKHTLPLRRTYAALTWRLPLGPACLPLLSAVLSSSLFRWILEVSTRSNLQLHFKNYKYFQCCVDSSSSVHSSSAIYQSPTPSSSAIYPHPITCHYFNLTINFLSYLLDPFKMKF